MCSRSIMARARSLRSNPSHGYPAVKSLAREAFHNYGQRLYLICKRQSQGSQRQKAVFMPAKWLFDRGDRARLTETAGF